MKADDRRIVQELASHYGLSANVQSGYMFYVCHTLFTSLIIMEKSRTSPPLLLCAAHRQPGTIFIVFIAGLSSACYDPEPHRNVVVIALCMILYCYVYLHHTG